MAVIRAATSSDLDFLQQMLAIAADWSPDATVRPVDEILREPELAHYVTGWPADGDFGVIAEDTGPLGAAWWRFFTGDDPGYGFVDETTPEVSIGVLPEDRGAGIGTRLLQALIGEAIGRGLAALSLSVEKTNPAARLYRRLGFVTVAASGGSDTMVLSLPR